MKLTEQQIKQKFKPKVDLTKPHLRWNHWINPRIQNGEFYFAIVGERKKKENTRDFLISELTRISGPVEELYTGGKEFKVSNPKLSGLLLKLQSLADPQFINWHKLGNMEILKDPDLYERITRKADQDIINYLEHIYN